MDNRRFDITSDGDIEPALAVAFMQGSVFERKTAFGWREDFVKADGANVHRLTLSWTEADGFAPFLVPQTVAEAAAAIRRWLAEQPTDWYPPAPSHDGDNGKAWRVYNDAWGHAGGTPRAFVAIEPAWAWYGK